MTPDQAMTLSVRFTVKAGLWTLQPDILNFRRCVRHSKRLQTAIADNTKTLSASTAVGKIRGFTFDDQPLKRYARLNPQRACVSFLRPHLHPRWQALMTEAMTGTDTAKDQRRLRKVNIEWSKDKQAVPSTAEI